MAEINPNLIPPPSIGESKKNFTEPSVNPKRSKLWLVVVTCIVAGIGLGVVVYQQSIAPSPAVSPRPSVIAVKPSPSPAVPEVSQVTPQSNTIVFPKAGQVRVYFGVYGANPAIANQKITLTAPNGNADVIMPGTVPTGDKLAYKDSGLTVTAGQSVTIAVYDRGDTAHPGYGWIAPVANKCGALGVAIDIAPYLTWLETKAGGEPVVSTQCWSDWNQPNDPAPRNYGDYLIVLSYTPPTQTVSPSPSAAVSPSPSAQASRSPSPSPAASKTPSPSPVASKTPTPTPIASKSPSPTPTDYYDDEEEEELEPSPRVTMPDPDASELPDAGIFEVTAGTVGIGLLFILLGILGLLLI